MPSRTGRGLRHAEGPARPAPPSNRSAGESGRTLTLLELLAAMLVIAAAALVAVPNWSSEKTAAFEEAAVRTLREIAEAQKAAQAADPKGRAKSLAELPAFSEEAAASSSWAGPGVLCRGGYCFVVWMTTSEGFAYRDREQAPPSVDPAGGSWVAFAWPERHGKTGRDVFALTPDGALYSADNPHPPYSGPNRVPQLALLSPILDAKGIRIAELGARTTWRELPRGAKR